MEASAAGGRVDELVASVRPVDDRAAAAARERQGQLVKPPGSLGRLEDLSAQLAGIAGRCPPPVPRRPAAVVAAGDHGVLAQGVSAWPAEVTALMVGEFCAGRAAVNALASIVGAEVIVLDVGVASELPAHPRLRAAKVARGTADLSSGPAMTGEQAAEALLVGAAMAAELTAAGHDLLIAGEMGIANTTPAACLIAAFTGASAADVTGPGAGADRAGLERKTEVVAQALAHHRPNASDGLGTLAALGGFEHAALAGLCLGAAKARVPLLLDGVSTVAAALAAAAIGPACHGCLVAGHRSTEPGATVGLAHLGVEPLVDLRMRLGEGTGALLAVPLIQSAAALLSEMATFAEAGIPT